MALIRSFRDVPPGGWRYVQPETGQIFESDNYDDLIRAILPHRTYKELPVDTIELDVQRQLCQQLSETECRPEPNEDYRPIRDMTHGLTTSMAISLSKSVVAMLAEVASGKSALCSKEESQARATVCLGCPFNRSVKQCSCSAVYIAIEASIPKDRRQAGLGVCAACGCSLQAKANLPLDVVRAGNPPERVFPPYCWQSPDTTLRGPVASDTTH